MEDLTDNNLTEDIKKSDLENVDRPGDESEEISDTLESDAKETAEDIKKSDLENVDGPGDESEEIS
ncbi:MAG: hypothetical protein QNK29_09665, partial [Desulfobacterales bacterium]|nr:hypothetical protein [Desulfobacterales bacterium]MDX2512188.1 hypothetical protein [Desulfobacterales bacterium]